MNMIQRPSLIFKSSLLALQVTILCLTQYTLFPAFTLAQQSFSLPKPAKPVPTPTELPSPTFGLTNPIPNQRTTPSVDSSVSREFNVYRLDVDDVVSINVQEFPEFNFIGPIDTEGNVIMPIVGRIAIAGLTLEEVEIKVSAELGRRFLLSEPVVFAVLATPRPVSVTMIGEIFKPGFYTVDSTTLLSDILILSGGTKETADLRNIIVRRSLSDGTVMEENVDLYTPLVTGGPTPKVPIQGGDTIIVSRLEQGNLQDYDRVLVSRSTLPVQTITVRVLAPVEPSGQALQSLSLPNGTNFIDVLAAVPLVDVLRVNVTDVALLRFDPERGKVVTQSINVRALLRGDVSYAVPLQDGDVVVIGRTLLGKVFAAFNVLTQPIRDISGFGIWIDRFN